MSSDFQFEEEDFSDTRVNTNTLFRILATVRPHWRWVAGFLSCISVVSVAEGFFTFLSKRIVDEAIIPRNPTALVQTLEAYAALATLFAILVFGFIFLAGGLGQKVRYDLRKKVFDHLQSLSFSYFDKTPVG